MSAYDSVKVPNITCPKCQHVFDDDDVQVKVYLGDYKPDYCSAAVALGEAMPEGFPRCTFEENGASVCPSCRTYFDLAVKFVDGRPVDARLWPEGGEGVLHPPESRNRKKVERREAARAERARRLDLELEGKLGPDADGWRKLGMLLMEPITATMNYPSRLRRYIIPADTVRIGSYEKRPGEKWTRRLMAELKLPKKPLPIPTGVEHRYDQDGSCIGFLVVGSEPEPPPAPQPAPPALDWSKYGDLVRTIRALDSRGVPVA